MVTGSGSPLPVVLLPAMPLKAYWHLLPEGDRDAWPDFQRKAAAGTIAHCYKQGRDWWINLLAHAQHGLNSPDAPGTQGGEPTANGNTEESDGTPSQAREGHRERDPARKPVVRKGARGRTGPDGDRPVRHRR